MKLASLFYSSSLAANLASSLLPTATCKRPARASPGLLSANSRRPRFLLAQSASSSCKHHHSWAQTSAPVRGLAKAPLAFSVRQGRSKSVPDRRTDERAHKRANTRGGRQAASLAVVSCQSGALKRARRRLFHSTESQLLPSPLLSQSSPHPMGAQQTTKSDRRAARSRSPARLQLARAADSLASAQQSGQLATFDLRALATLFRATDFAGKWTLESRRALVCWPVGLESNWASVLAMRCELRCVAVRTHARARQQAGQTTAGGASAVQRCAMQTGPKQTSFSLSSPKFLAAMGPTNGPGSSPSISQQEILVVGSGPKLANWLRCEKESKKLEAIFNLPIACSGRQKAAEIWPVNRENERQN